MGELLEWDDMSVEERAGVKYLSELSPLSFMRIWFQVNQGMKFRVNWHHRLMDLTAMRVMSGEAKNVVFNMPPGGTKTEYWSVHLPAYCFTKFRRTRTLNISYSKSLVEENSNRTKNLITSSEYQELWPCKLGKADVANWVVLDDRGRNKHQMFSRSSGGQITGVRGGYMGSEFSGYISVDDPDKADAAFSATMRAKSRRILTNTIRSRRASPDTPVLCIQQRLHTDDASGFMLSGGMGLTFEHIMVPALVTREYIDALPEDIRKHAIEDVMSGKCIERGGVEYWSYWPAKESIDDLMALWDKDDYTFLSQYMQNPKALTGGMMDPEWLGRYEQLPYLVWRAIYVDTAQKKGEQNDFSVFTYCGLGVDGNLYVINIKRGKWDAGELHDEAIKFWNEQRDWDVYRPAALRYMKVEDKSSGTGLIQMIQRGGNIQVDPIPRGPGANKITRCMDTVPWMKSGRVFVPALYDSEGNRLDGVKEHRGHVVAPNDWVVPFLSEVASFTADDSHQHDDQVDTLFDAVADMLSNSSATDFSTWV